MGFIGRSYEWNSWQKVRVTADTLYAWIRSCEEVTGNFDAKSTEIHMRLFYINYLEAGKRRSSISGFLFIQSTVILLCFVLFIHKLPKMVRFGEDYILLKIPIFCFFVLILLSFSSSNSYVVWFSFSEIDHSSSHTGDSSHEQSCRNLKNSLDTV